MTAVFNARTVGRVLFAMAALSYSSARSADRLYYFVDEQGVSHFSNVPADPRYRPLPSAGARTATQPDAASARATHAVPGAIARTAGPAAHVLDAPVSEEMVSNDTFVPSVEVEPPDEPR
jgi:uncharacterized protein DUF4124